MSKSSTAQWGSRLGFILASAGSAIGLGAIWKFPFWAGANGGATFILPYILFTFTVGLALLTAEFAIGRSGRGCASAAMRRLGGKFFGLLGGISVLTSFLILSYYTVVGGWCLSYLLDAFSGSVVSLADPEILKEHFGALVSDGLRNVFWHLAFLTLTCVTVALGVQKGIERLSKYLMPTLFILMLVLTVRGLMLPGAWEGVRYLFDFRWENLTGSAVLNAMGFTFFSLSVGAGILVTYGAYLSEKTCIVTSSAWVAVLAIEASLLAGFMIIPAVFAFGLEPDSGPGLVFITVPLIFSNLPAGWLFAVLFYVCLLTAALTSAVSLLEVVAACLQNEWRLSRRTASLVSWTTLAVIGAICALSFGVWSDITVFGLSIFDALDFLCTNLLMPLGGLAVAALAGWKAWPAVRGELTAVTPFGSGTLALIRLAVAVFSPALVLVALYQGLFG